MTIEGRELASQRERVLFGNNANLNIRPTLLLHDYCSAAALAGTHVFFEILDNSSTNISSSVVAYIIYI